MTRGLIPAAACLAAALIAVPGSAEARKGRYVASGIIGGVSAGAIVAGGYYPGYVGYPAPVYYPGPVHYRAPTYPPPGCVIRRQPVFDGYGWRSRKIRVCY
jgi:hypothetical protein